MRIVVVADTHMPRRAKELPVELLRAVDSADLVAHLGDFTEHEVIDAIAALCPLVAVHGNNDSDDVQSRCPERLQITAEGFTLVLVHGHVGGRTALDAARRERGADAVLFGHSHQAYSAWENGRLLFNPGSPTDKRWAPYRSFGVLKIATSICPSIVRIG